MFIIIICYLNLTLPLHFSRSSNQKLTGTIYQYGSDSDSFCVDIDLTPLSALSLRVPHLDNLSSASVWLQGRKISHAIRFSPWTLRTPLIVSVTLWCNPSTLLYLPSYLPTLAYFILLLIIMPFIIISII